MAMTLTTSNDLAGTAKEILRKPYARKLVPEDSGGFSASIQEFPGCFAEGETAEEALENLDRVAESWVTVSLANGRAIRDPISFDGVSGKIALRIPRGLHQEIAELAESEECSLNQLLTSAIAEYVGRARTLSTVSGTVERHLLSLQRMHFAVVGGWTALEPEAHQTLVSSSGWSSSFINFDGIAVVNSGAITYQERP